MIEPLAIKEEHNYSREDIQEYYVRRFKNDIDDDAVRSNFQDREVVSIHAQLSDAENEFLQIQQNIKFAALQNLTPDDISTSLFGKQTNRKKIYFLPLVCSSPTCHLPRQR
jgi:hypothetical protein